MSKLVRSLGRSILDGINQSLSVNRDESGLVRMFEVEYHKEYRHARKAGAEVNDAFVRSFLATHKVM